MGGFTTKKGIITICDEKNWDAGEYVKARTVVLSGDEEWVLNQQMLIEMPKQGNRKQRRASGFQKQKNADIAFKNQVGATRRLWVQKMLEEWVIYGDEGQEIPFAKSGEDEKTDKQMGKIMQGLKQEYIDFIFEAIQDAQPKEVKQEEQEEEEDEEDDEEGSPFFDNASSSIVGETSNSGRTSQELTNFLENMETPNHRNFLAK
jgi:hypothetical protein